MKNIPKISFLGKRALRDEINTTSRLIKPSKIRNAAKSEEEEYRRAIFTTTQLYPQMRTSTMSDRTAVLCEDRWLNIFISSQSVSWASIRSKEWARVQTLESRLNVRQKDQFLNFYLLLTFPCTSPVLSCIYGTAIDTEGRVGVPSRSFIGPTV